MTTATTNTPISNAATANFRAWGLEFNTQLAAVGLTQTADTGQINWTTVALPGAANTIAGFEIWRFNDALQATSPIFIKIQYGTSSLTSIPLILIQVGQGSNGSGTLTGTLMTNTAMSAAQQSSSVTNAPAFWCYNATYGTLWCSWKFGVNNAATNANTPLGGFLIERSCDTNGNPTGDAVALTTPNLNTSASLTSGNATQVYSYLTSALLTPSVLTAALCGWSYLWPMNPASSATGANSQVMPRWIYTPNMQLSAVAGLCLLSEFTTGSTFGPVALVGTTTKTYIVLGGFFGSSNVCAQLNVQTMSGYALWQ
jgi:hypothetical protein